MWVSELVGDKFKLLNGIKLFSKAFAILNNSNEEAWVIEQSIFQSIPLPPPDLLISEKIKYLN